MDIRMPHMDGLEAAGASWSKDRECRVIMLTTFDLDRYVYEALSAGRSGPPASRHRQESLDQRCEQHRKQWQ